MADVDRSSVVFSQVSDLTSGCFSSRDWPNAYSCDNVVGVWVYAYIDDEKKSIRRVEYRVVMAVN